MLFGSILWFPLHKKEKMKATILSIGECAGREDDGRAMVEIRGESGLDQPDKLDQSKSNQLNWFQLVRINRIRSNYNQPVFGSIIKSGVLQLDT